MTTDRTAADIAALTPSQASPLCKGLDEAARDALTAQLQVMG